MRSSLILQFLVFVSTFAIFGCNYRTLELDVDNENRGLEAGTEDADRDSWILDDTANPGIYPGTCVEKRTFYASPNMEYIEREEFVTSVYDNRGNILSRVLDPHGDGSAESSETYTYDEKGNMLSSERKQNGVSQSRTEYVYDNNGLLLSETDYNLRPTARDDGIITKSRVEYIYDNDGALQYTHHYWYSNEGVQHSRRPFYETPQYRFTKDGYGGDSSGDGIVDWCVTYNEYGERVTGKRDSDDNWNWNRAYIYDDYDNLLSLEIDEDMDGNVDEWRTYSYECWKRKDGHWIYESDGKDNRLARLPSDFEDAAGNPGDSATACLSYKAVDSSLTDNECLSSSECWYDSSTGLSWEIIELYTYGNWHTFEDAIDHCQNLEIGGHSDWRVPSIQELISLIRGCDQSACDLSDPDCLDISCMANCTDPCTPGYGPARFGCYFDPGIGELNCHPDDVAGVYADYYWTSSFSQEEPDSTWYSVFFLTGEIITLTDSESTIRCVRGSPDLSTDI